MHCHAKKQHKTVPEAQREGTLFDGRGGLSDMRQARSRVLQQVIYTAQLFCHFGV